MFVDAFPARYRNEEPPKFKKACKVDMAGYVL
jgi:hypothetical protein